jgi:hypothetical protein
LLPDRPAIFHPGNGIATQHAGEGFTYRAQLEQGLWGDGFVRRNIGFTEGEVVADPDKSPPPPYPEWPALHQRRNGTFHHLSQLFF